MRVLLRVEGQVVVLNDEGHGSGSCSTVTAMSDWFSMETVLSYRTVQPSYEVLVHGVRRAMFRVHWQIPQSFGMVDIGPGYLL